MSLRKISLKILLAVLAIALMIPLAPLVSTAKAKLCRQTICARMDATVKNGGAPSKHCHHLKEPIDCCKENGSQFVTYEEPETFLTIIKGSGESLEKSPVMDWVTTIDTSLDNSNLTFRYPNKIKRSKSNSPPVYVSHSSFLI